MSGYRRAAQLELRGDILLFSAVNAMLRDAKLLQRRQVIFDGVCDKPLHFFNIMRVGGAALTKSGKLIVIFVYRIKML